MELNEDQQTEAVFKSMRGDVDPVSGNEVPPGSLPEEVRDDIPAMLSEGEYVVPADVLRYYGVKFFEDLRSEAKMGLSDMEANGRIGGEPVMDDELPFSDEELMVEDMGDDTLEMNRGGVVGFAPGGLNVPGYIKQPDLSFLGGAYAQGTSGTGGVEYRSYVNDAGMSITIPFFNGEPMGMIPPGYKPGEATTGLTEDGTGGVTDTGEIEREGRPGNVEQDPDRTPISQMDAVQLAEAKSKALSPAAKTALGVFGAITGLPVGFLGIADKMSQKSIESRAEELGIDLSTVTKGEDLNRSNFVSDDAFNSAMESVAPEGTTYDADRGSYTRSDDSLAPTTSARPQARPGSDSTSSSSGSKGLGQSVAEALGFDSFGDMFDGGGKGASASDSNDSADNDNDADPANDGPGRR
jgi:hypothetical protein